MKKNLEGFGPHIMCDIVGIKKEILSDLNFHLNFLKEVPKIINMTPICEPLCFHYNGLVPEDSGITGFQIIAESHISIHSFEKKNYCFVDIFSCKPFDYEKILNYFQEIFQPKELRHYLQKRGLDFPR